MAAATSASTVGSWKNSSAEFFHLLLVTDDDDTALEIETALRETHVIFKSKSIFQGFSLLKGNCPDMILYDSNCGSLDFKRAVKNASVCDIPLILILSPEDGRGQRAFFSEGAADYLLKPIGAEEIRQRVQLHLEKFQAKKILQKALCSQSTSLVELSEELIHSNKLKDEFFAILSHELRNPMNVITGFAEILKSDEGQTPQTRAAADAIYRNAQIQMHLINDLLDIAKGIAGKWVLDCHPVDISKILSDLSPSIEENAKKKNLDLTIKQENGLGLVHGDPARISQVIWNLLSNAIKFTPEQGHILVQVSRKENSVEFSVQDSGVGIDPQFLPMIFERFRQQDRSITKIYGGLGLGLAIVKHIVELHGGTISVTSQGLGCGATFSVRFPLVARSAPEEAATTHD